MKLPLTFNPLPTSGPDQRGCIRDASGQTVVADIDKKDGDFIVNACNKFQMLVDDVNDLNMQIASMGGDHS